MHTLVLFTHPEPTSLTGSTAHRIASELVASGGTAEVADLAGEGFDPRYTEADLAVLRGTGPVPADVRREQERIERADAIVLVHPIYWWSTPALLKGWLDRVFTFGWAFGTDSATVLAERDIHLVGFGGNAPETYDRHGYRDAIRTSIEHGIFDFVSGPLASTQIVHSAPEELDGRVDETVTGIVEAITSRAPALTAN